MRFVIVTGMSGAGRSTALNVLEDAGYYCVDNMPMPLIARFAKMAKESNGEYDKIAIGMDVRLGREISDANELFEELSKMEVKAEVLFLDTSDDVLIKRYKETRRSHPLSGNVRVENGISLERELLQSIKEKADYVLDTSTLLVRDLKKEIEDIFVGEAHFNSFLITILSFGYKYGIPTDADLVFDVRFLANPYYVPKLKKLTGEDKKVRDFVMESDTSKEFMERFTSLIEFLIPNYINEGKNGLVIAIGCTGGKHRSVTVATELYDKLNDEGLAVVIEHRDIKR